MSFLKYLISSTGFFPIQAFCVAFISYGIATINTGGLASIAAGVIIEVASTYGTWTLWKKEKK